MGNQPREPARSGVITMANQYPICAEDEILDLIETDGADTRSAITLYAGGSDAGEYGGDPHCFNPSLHMSLMSAYWRKPVACPQDVTVTTHACSDVSDGYFTPESWLRCRLGRETK